MNRFISAAAKILPPPQNKQTTGDNSNYWRDKESWKLV